MYLCLRRFREWKGELNRLHQSLQSYCSRAFYGLHRMLKLAIEDRGVHKFGKDVKEGGKDFQHYPSADRAGPRGRILERTGLLHPQPWLLVSFEDSPRFGLRFVLLPLFFPSLSLSFSFFFFFFSSPFSLNYVWELMFC